MKERVLGVVFHQLYRTRYPPYARGGGGDGRDTITRFKTTVEGLYGVLSVLTLTGPEGRGLAFSRLLDGMSACLPAWPPVYLPVTNN